MGTLPVNSSAPQHSTSTSPRQKQSPPTARCTANGTAGSPRNTQKYSAPNAMNAPASIADAKHFAFGMAALASPTFSAFSAISAGDSASGLSVWISSCIMIASGSFLAWSRLLRVPWEAARHGTATRGRREKQGVFLDNFPISSSCSSHRRIDTRPSVHRGAEHWYTLASGRVGCALPTPVFEKGVSMANPSRTDLLRALPQVEEMLQLPEVSALLSLVPRSVLADCVREAVDELRQAVLADACARIDERALADAVRARALAKARPSLRRVINATGIVVHTNLGRSPLADEAVSAVSDVARGYSTLEYDTDAMARGSRHDHVERLICTLTGAEAALAVNNNAAAVMMVLHEFARGHEAVVSRGELVEIGGSFRVPDIMELSQARMVEVGTTNKTHAVDYERAIGADTSMLLKVHPSNYRVVGFAESVSARDLRPLADAENARRTASGEPGAGELLVYEDQGSGAFLNLDAFGAYAEPTVAESLQAGCDLVSFSGDKLLGGPQAGIIVGAKRFIDRLKKNPYARAMRLDKMTLAALEATLRLYLDPAIALERIPALRMLSEPAEAVRGRAERLARTLEEALPAGAARIDVVPDTARAGGGALPLCDIDSHAVRIEFSRGDAQGCETFLIARRDVPVIGRIKHDAVLLDARTVAEDELAEVAEAVRAYFDALDAGAEGSRA